MNTDLLISAHKALTACGFVHEDKGGIYVPLEKKFLLPMVLQPNQNSVFQKEIVGQTVWGLRAISSDQGMNTITGVRLNIQMPNGRYLIGGSGVDVGQFAWVGSYRYWMDELECEPGSKISVSLSDANTGGLANPLAVNLVFEGCFKYYLRGRPGIEAEALLASQLPRYQGIVNENVLAPCWWQGVGPSTPPGFKDDLFTYSSSVVAIALAGPVSATTKIDIDSTSDFVCSRLLVDLEPDSTVTTGSVLMRLRVNDGYALMDDYLDVPRLISGAEWPVNWYIKAGDQVVVELALVDATGTGNMSVQVHLEGSKRRAG